MRWQALLVCCALIVLCHGESTCDLALIVNAVGSHTSEDSDTTPIVSVTLGADTLSTVSSIPTHLMPTAFANSGSQLAVVIGIQPPPNTNAAVSESSTHSSSPSTSLSVQLYDVETGDLQATVPLTDSINVESYYIDMETTNNGDICAIIGSFNERRLWCSVGGAAANLGEMGFGLDTIVLLAQSARAGSNVTVVRFGTKFPHLVGHPSPFVFTTLDATTGQQMGNATIKGFIPVGTESTFAYVFNDGRALVLTVTTARGYFTTTSSAPHFSANSWVSRTATSSSPTNTNGLSGATFTSSSSGVPKTNVPITRGHTTSSSGGSSSGGYGSHQSAPTPNRVSILLFAVDSIFADGQFTLLLNHTLPEQREPLVNAAAMNDGDQWYLSLSLGFSQFLVFTIPNNGTDIHQFGPLEGPLYYGHNPATPTDIWCTTS